MKRLIPTLGFFALLACSTTTGAVWDYGMDTTVNGSTSHCGGTAAMQISSGRIEWDRNGGDCRGGALGGKGSIVYDIDKGWLVKNPPKDTRCLVELPRSAGDTSQGVLIHCESQCSGPDQCNNASEYRFIPRK